MKKIYTVMLLCGMISTQIFGQKFDWAQRGGHYAYDYGWATATDANGNVFVAGKYEEAGAVFGQFTVGCAGNHDIFVAKYDNTGAIKWIRTAGGPGGDYAHAICIDPSGNVIVAGEVEDAGYFGTVPFTAKSKDNDVFIAKYSNDGALLYVKTAGGYTNDKAYAVTSDKDGNAYITGQFEGAASFGTINLTSAGYRDIFVAKYNAAGAEQWAVRAGGPDTDEGKGISVNAAGELYVTGFFKGAADFSSNVTKASKTVDYDDMFLSRYNTADGSLVWVQTAGGDYDDDSWALTTTSTGKVYVTGEYNAYCIFDNTHALTTAGKADMFIASYDNTGTVQWVSTGGGPSIDRARGICADASGNAFVTGQYGSKGVFGTTTLSAADESDIFVAGYDAAGKFKWAVAAAGPADPIDSLGFESGLAIAINTAGQLYVSGCYLGTTYFGNSQLDPYTRTDMFVTQVSQTGINGTAGINNMSAVESFDVFPNPNSGKFTVNLSLSERDNYTVELSSMLGQVVYSEKLTGFEGAYSHVMETAPYNKGIYTIKVVNSKNDSFVKKVVVY